MLSSHLRLGLPSGLLPSGLPKESVQVRGALKHFVKIKKFYGEVLLTPRPIPMLEDHPLSAVRDCLFNTFAATLRTQRTFLQPQPVDAPCCGDQGPPEDLARNIHNNHLYKCYRRLISLGFETARKNTADNEKCFMF
jgi:hypothetical protein